MNKKEFSNVRDQLGKTQAQLAVLLGISIRTIQSYEQGLRSIPINVERQLLLLLSLKEGKRTGRACWETRKCSPEIRQNCPAWEFNAGMLCWFINGTMCEGRIQRDWKAKMKICRSCEIFTSLLG